MRPHYLPKRPRLSDVLTYRWPMTNQALYPHSKPLSHYLDRHVERLEGKPPATHCLSFHPLLLNDVHRTWSPFIGIILCLLRIILAWCVKGTCSVLFMFTVAVVSAEVTARQSTDMFKDWRHAIETQRSDFCQRTGMSLHNDASWPHFRESTCMYCIFLFTSEAFAQ